MLEPVGLSSSEETVYRFLLSVGEASAVATATDTGFSARTTAAVLRSLQEKGLATVVQGRPLRWVPISPDIALEALIGEKAQELQRVRMYGLELLESFRESSRKRRSSESVEIVRTGAAIRQRFQQLQAAAQREVRLFDRPPYGLGGADHNPEEKSALTRGVSYRVIYDRVALEQSQRLAGIEGWIRAGEQARVIDALPMKMAIADGLVAMISDPAGTAESPLTISAAEAESLDIEEALVIPPGALLDCLAQCFEILWQRALPLDAGLGETHAAREEDVRILQLMAAGMKDEAIARHVGMRPRTLQRRVARLMVDLGASTRFQAGLEAARQGWI